MDARQPLSIYFYTSLDDFISPTWDDDAELDIGQHDRLRPRIKNMGC